MNDDEPKKRGRKPVTDGTNKVMVTFRVSPEMKNWLDECAAKGAVKAEIFDLALELAKRWIDGDSLTVTVQQECALSDIGDRIRNYGNA